MGHKKARERPIIFSPEMVFLIRRGCKTQTRRVIKPQPDFACGKLTDGETGLPMSIEACPLGRAGDLLWVKELWSESGNGGILYKADFMSEGPDAEGRRAFVPDASRHTWRTPLFMPRVVSRVTLEIVGVGIERLHDMDASGGRAEGFPSEGPEDLQGVARFAEYWDSLNAGRGYPWADNPWVWVISFNVLSVSDGKTSLSFDDCKDGESVSRFDAGLHEAIEVAAEAHAGQLDKCGYPYICHSMAVMRFQKEETARIAGILHDVVEDTPLTLEDLGRLGFANDVVAAVDALTHREDEPYEDYIGRVCLNRVACLVKLADIRDNLDPRRTVVGPGKRFQKYRPAMRKIRAALALYGQGDGLSEEEVYGET